MSGRTDPRAVRTIGALRQAVVELASQRPLSQITVAELADRAGVTRATFYNRYGTALEPLTEVLYADLEAGHRLEEQSRADGQSGQVLLRLAVTGVAEHVERFGAVYRNTLADPADRGVYDAMVRHFSDYAIRFLARADDPGRPDADHRVIAQFLAHGFTGAIKAWLSDPAVTREDLVDAAIACAPAWWTACATASDGPLAPPTT